MRREIQQKTTTMKNLRFLRGAPANESQYVKYCGMEETTKLLKGNLSHFPFHYSQLYLTVSNSFDPLSETNFTFEIDSFSSTPPFVPRIRSTPILNSPITLEPPVQNIISTSTQANPPLVFCISSSGPESPPSVLTPALSSDFIYPKKGSNWRTVVINANSITHKRAEI